MHAMTSDQLITELLTAAIAALDSLPAGHVRDALSKAADAVAQYLGRSS